MQRNIILENTLKAYFEKQKSFKILIKNVQASLQSKEYKYYNCTFEEFIKRKWNISKAQAYRYLISAKVIDQLQEFNIQPCYERICRSLYSYAKTPKQMKLLWESVLESAGNRPDCINSSHVTKMWKKLCMDKKYAKICHYEDEIMTKVERYLNNSKERRNRQLNKNINNVSCYNDISKATTQIKNVNDINISTNTIINNNEFVSMNSTSNLPQMAFYPSPNLNIPIVQYKNETYCNNQNIIHQSPAEYQVVSLNDTKNSQVSCCPSPISNIPSIQNNKTIQYNFPASPNSITNETPSPNINQTNIQNISISPINNIEYPVINNQTNISNTNINSISVQPINNINYTTTGIKVQYQQQQQQQHVEYQQYPQSVQNYQEQSHQQISGYQYSQSLNNYQKQPQQVIYYY